MNKNKVYTEGFSNPDSLRIYKTQWIGRTVCRQNYLAGWQCGGCSFYAEFNEDWGLCCNKKSHHFTETVFEHFTCKFFVGEGWGPHSFSENSENHCWCYGDKEARFKQICPRCKGVYRYGKEDHPCPSHKKRGR